MICICTKCRMETASFRRPSWGTSWRRSARSSATRKSSRYRIRNIRCVLLKFHCFSWNIWNLFPQLFAGHEDSHGNINYEEFVRTVMNGWEDGSTTSHVNWCTKGNERDKKNLSKVTKTFGKLESCFRRYPPWDNLRYALIPAAIGGSGSFCVNQPLNKMRMTL